MIIYADIYILINFFCNFISLAVCAAVTCSRVGYIRLSLSAFIMALYSFFMLFFDINPLFRMLVDFLMLPIGMIIAFGKSKLSFLMKNSCIFFVSCIVTGGIAGMISGVTLTRAVITLLIAPIIYLVWYLSVKNMRHSQKLVSVIIDGKTLSGLSDSGNILYDNQRGLHIIVAKSEKLGVGEELFAGWIKTETVCGVGYMPYYYPDSVEVEHRKVRAAVALTESADLSYDCIVPDELT